MNAKRPGKRIAAALAAGVLALAASQRAEAQAYRETPIDVRAYKPTPADRCFSLAGLRIGPERAGAGSPLPHELMPRLDEALAACEQAVKDRPAEGRLHAGHARMLALRGDGKGALEAARKGAELGSPAAQVLLGVMHADGVHVPRDYAAAREQLRRAAKQGDPYAHFNLGAMFANGWGMEADDTDAAASFGQAARGGDVLAMQLAGQRYDKAQAEAWWKKAAEAMYPEGPANPLRIARLARAELDGAAMLAWYEQKARGGEPWAQAYLGALHEAGQWVAGDYAAAATWYRRAAEAGHVPAQWRLAKLYREGRGVPRDEAEARRWAQRWQVQRCEVLERAEPGANACDRLAADSHDPDKAAPGIDSFCMRHFAQQAVRACTQASREFPATVRYRAQLARALAHTGSFDEARREAGRAAAAGSSPAMILMGVMSQRGLGGAVNEAEALAWYRKAAELGNARAAGLVVASAQNGVGVAKGSPEAQSLMDAMRDKMVRYAPTPASQAERGDPREQHNLAARLEREKKYDEALQWYTRAAEQGFEPSAMNLAQMYEQGIGVKPDAAEAMRRYRKLAEQGNGEARYRLAKLAADAGQFDEAVKLYGRSVRDDDYRAMLELGQLYEQGRGVPKDVRRAAGLYEQAAERSPWARFKLGAMHLAGEGIAKDYAKAHRWLRRSADDGNANARNTLGVMYEQGLGVAIDRAAARDLYIAALRGANPQAKGNLERFFAEGRGAPAGAAALEWYRGGAEAGIASAQYRLGRLYAKGEGVPRNDAEALIWLERAAEQGHRQARKEAAELYFAKGEHLQAAMLGDERAARALAAQLAKDGKPDAAAELLRHFRAAARELPPAPVWPAGFSLDPGEDPQRTMQVRVAGVGSIQAARVDAGMANVYDIIRWFPETDGKGNAK